MPEKGVEVSSTRADQGTMDIKIPDEDPFCFCRHGAGKPKVGRGGQKIRRGGRVAGELTAWALWVQEAAAGMGTSTHTKTPHSLISCIHRIHHALT